MIFFLDACTDSGFLSVIYFIKKMIDIVFLVLPIILIVMISVDLAKNVMAKGADDMKKNTNIAIKRIIYCVFAFLIPTIVNLVINTVYDLTSNNGTKENALLCWKNATKDNIQKYKEIEEAEQKAKEEKDKQAANDKHNQNKQNMDSDKPSGGLGGKTDEDGDGNGGSSGGDSSGGTTTVSNYTLYVGDSRTVGMCQVVTLSSNEECVSKVGAGYVWLEDTALPDIYSKLESNQNANVVINIGVNNLARGNSDTIQTLVNNYVKLYKGIMEKYPNAKVVVVSVGTGDESKQQNAVSKGSLSAVVPNTNVNSFNTKMAKTLSGTNIKFCNINNNIRNNYITSEDGLHYTSATYKNIYEETKKCL